MRGADGGPWRRLCALPAFWVSGTFGVLMQNPYVVKDIEVHVERKSVC